MLLARGDPVWELSSGQPRSKSKALGEMPASKFRHQETDHVPPSAGLSAGCLGGWIKMRGARARTS
jgi:hypothetical protein